jgi:hypothetical protein
MDREFRMRWLREAQRSHGKKVRFATDSPLEEAGFEPLVPRRHPGLYTSGNVAAATEHGVGYQAGLLLASSMTFSYLAVRHMIEGRQPVRPLLCGALSLNCCER